MEIEAMIGYACIGLLLWAVIRFTMNRWYHRMDGTGHEVDLNIIGHRGSWSGGDIEPDTIPKIERMLKEEANSDSPGA